jgi:D-arabinose 1-dehydrogenase-like Zn-dependent alcohol dehydrogenase
VAGGDCGDVNIILTLLFLGSRTVKGTSIGTAIDEEDALKFNLLADIHPMVETMPLEKASDAYARMMNNQARFRIVLTMGN